MLEARPIQNASPGVAKSRLTSKDFLSVRSYCIDRELSEQPGTWVIGARVRVRLTEADPDRRKILFGLA